jgi:hypothetical protein
VIESKDRVQFIIGQRSVDRGDRAQHVRVQVDLVERDGIVKAIVEVVSHRFTSVAEAGPSRCLPGYGQTPWPRMTHQDHFSPLL